jgi:hypothetical protein
VNGNRVIGYKPDVQRIRVKPDGTRVVDVTEIQSPSQNKDFMNRKRDAMRTRLGGQAGVVTWGPRQVGAIRR